MVVIVLWSHGYFLPNEMQKRNSRNHSEEVRGQYDYAIEFRTYHTALTRNDCGQSHVPSGEQTRHIAIRY